jgi:predicted nucleic acid-binding protein
LVIVDTTVWVDYFRGESNAEASWLAREIDRKRLGLPDVILCEVLQGVRNDREFDVFLKDLYVCEVLNTGGPATAVAAARNYRELRRRGITVRKTIDCWIATYCILQGHSLIHRDRDFDPFETCLGLQVIHA